MPVFSREMIRYLKLLDEGINYEDWLRSRREARRKREETRLARLKEAEAKVAEAKEAEAKAKEAAAKLVAEQLLKEAALQLQTIKLEEQKDKKQEIADKRFAAVAGQMPAPAGGPPASQPDAKSEGQTPATPETPAGTSPDTPSSDAGGAGIDGQAPSGAPGPGTEPSQAVPAESVPPPLPSQAEMISELVRQEEGVTVEPLDEKSLRRLKFLRDLIKTEIVRMKKQKGPDHLASIDDLAGKKYSIIWKVMAGQGGRAKTYKAKHADFPTHSFAAKVYEFGGKPRDEYLAENFSTDSLRIIRHIGKKQPTIIQTWDIFTTDDKLIIIQELATQGTIQSYGKVPDEKLGGKWCRQICRAIDQLGEIGISHRKIEPHHILLAHKELEAKLSGFYAACLYWNHEKNEAVNLIGNKDGNAILIANTANSSNQEVQGSQMGANLEEVKSFKEDFDAPETHAEGKPFDASRADTWSLGALFFFVFSRKYPFDVNGGPPTDVAIAQNVAALSLSEEGKSLIIAMLKLDPKSRIKINDVFNHPWIRKQV